MALTTAEFNAWISNPQAVKCTLLEVQVYDGTQEKTLYLSNCNYGTGPADTPSNTQYLPLLRNSVQFTESLSLEGEATLSYGDISLNNYNGELDYLLDYVWTGRSVKIFMGDVSHFRNDFTIIFDGIVSDVSSSDTSSINIQLRDKLQRINNSIYDVILGDYGSKGAENSNRNEVKPLTFGEVTNITPLLIDDVLSEYMVHDGPIERIIEVRDNGVPVSHQDNLAAGTFKLINRPVGTVTCSVQGDSLSVNNAGSTISSYKNTVAKIIQRILTAYGNQDTLISVDELDLVNFNAFDSQHQQPVGIHVSARENVISVCNNLARSIGAQLVATRTGKFKLLKIQTPTSNTDYITSDSILRDSLSISQKVPVQSSIKLGYCFNYTIQEGVLTVIPEEHKAFYAKDWLVITVTDDAAKTLYKQNADPVQKDTYILSNIGGEVTAEAQRLLDLYKVQRYVYSLQCIPAFINIELGKMITLVHHRFGLTAGKPAQVISVAVDWGTGYVTLEVLV
jgi:hypothetical protein